MSLPILCTHTLTVISIIAYIITHTQKRMAKFDLIPFRMTHSKHCCFFRQLVIVIDIDGALHSVCNGNNSISSPFIHTSRILFCFVEHHLDNIFTKVNERMCLLIFVILSPLFRFRFCILVKYYIIFVLFYLLEWCAIWKRVRNVRRIWG